MSSAYSSGRCVVAFNRRTPKQGTRLVVQMGLGYLTRYRSVRRLDLLRDQLSAVVTARDYALRVAGRQVLDLATRLDEYLASQRVRARAHVLRIESVDSIGRKPDRAGAKCPLFRVRGLLAVCGISTVRDERVARRTRVEDFGKSRRAAGATIGCRAGSGGGRGTNGRGGEHGEDRRRSHRAPDEGCIRRVSPRTWGAAQCRHCAVA